MSHYPPKRSSSPGSRKAQIPAARASTNTFSSSPYDPYSAYSRSPERDEYVSPRSSNSGGAIPISTETYVTYPANSSATRTPTTDSYSGQQRRRSTFSEFDNPALSSRRPAAFYDDTDHPRSPSSRTYEHEAHVKPAPAAKQTKLYSVSDGKPAQLIAETEIDSRSDRERGRERRGYHPTSAPTYLRDIEEGYYYTDAEGIGVDRGNTRLRTSVDPYGALGQPLRSSAPRNGPPLSTRGFENVTRSGSLRDPIGSASREHRNTYDRYDNDDVDFYDVPRRSSSPTRETSFTNVHPDDKYHNDHDDHRESRLRDRFRDDYVESRGFGIRSASTEPPRHVDPPRQTSWDEQYNHGRVLPLPLPAPVYSSDLTIVQPDPRDFMPRPIPADGRHSSHDDGRRSSKEQAYKREQDRDYDRHWDHEHKDSITPAVAGTAAAAVGVGAGVALDKSRRDRDNRDIRYETEEEERWHGKRSGSPNNREDARERDYAERDRLADEARKRDKFKDPETLDPDEDYRRRVQQQELELAEQTSRESQVPDGEGRSQTSERRRLHKERPHDKDGDWSSSSDKEPGRMLRRRDRDRDAKLKDEPSNWHDRDSTSGRASNPESDAAATSTALTIPGTFENELSEPEDHKKKTENRVRIVEPAKSESPPPQPIKSILRKPTKKFPEDPNPIREGVAPLKDAKIKDKNIPPGARWTKISRDLVNPKALDEAEERYEERQDCVIVLRVLSREEIEKLAKRTREIREERYERERERERHSGGKDKERGKEKEERDREKEKEREKEREKDGERRDERKGAHHRRRHHHHRDGDSDTDADGSEYDGERDSRQTVEDGKRAREHRDRDRDRGQ